MATLDYLRIYWAGVSAAINLVSSDGAAETFTIAGDHAREYQAGTPFTIAGTVGNNGTYASTGAVFGGVNTVISVAAVAGSEGAVGNISQPQRFIEFEWSKLKPRWSNPDVKDKDRYGIEHTFVPPDSTKAQRFCNTGMLLIDPLDIDLLDNTGTSWWIQLYNLAVTAHTEFQIFQYEVTRRGGADHTVKRCFKCYIEDMEELLGTLADDGQIARADVPFSCHSDGLFDTFADSITAGGLHYRTRPSGSP